MTMTAIRIELAKYFVAGTLAFLSDFSIFLALTKGFDVHYLVANVFGFCLGLTVSYLCCIRWVFAHRTYGVARVELPVFLGISLVMLLIGEVILLGLVEYAALTTTVAKIVMTGMIFLGNFALKKLLLFRRKAAR
jgi:putative flippase GtrA